MKSIKNEISCVILTKNEKENLERCLKSVREIKDVVVIDDFSVDGSGLLIKKFKVRLFQRKFDSLKNQRIFGAAKTFGNWSLFLDADECLTKKGLAEIKDTLLSNKKECYAIPRENIVFNRTLRYGDWYPDYQVRLMKKRHINFDPPKNKIGYLKIAIKHYSHQNYGEWWQKYRQSTTIQAQKERVGSFAESLKDAWSRLIKFKGYQDGMIGIFTIFYLPFFQATVILKYFWRKLWSH